MSSLPLYRCAIRRIFPSNKQRHFQQLAALSGIRLQDMVFFDNQMDNVESVRPMGVTCVYTPHGMTTALFEEGLKAFADGR